MPSQPQKQEYPRLEIREVAELRSHPDGVRTHSAESEFYLRESVKEFDLVRLLTVNARTNTVLDGDLLLSAVRALGRKNIPCWVIDVAPEVEDVIHLALNNHAGEWQWEPVSKLLKAVKDRNANINLTGFHEYDYGPLIAADWAPAAKGPLDGSDPNQIGLL